MYQQKSLARIQKRWHITSVTSKIRFICGLQRVSLEFLFSKAIVSRARVCTLRRPCAVSQLCVVTRYWRGPHVFIRIKIWACFRNAYTDTGHGHNAEYITVLLLGVRVSARNHNFRRQLVVAVVVFIILLLFSQIYNVVCTYGCFYIRCVLVKVRLG